MTSVLIRHLGSLLDISLDGNTPTPPAIVELLAPQLSYTHKTLLRGGNRWSPDGERAAGVQLQHVKMYAFEEGRLTTGVGFLTRITEVLRTAGYTVYYQNLAPPANPQVYVPNWENLTSRMQLRPMQPECLNAIASNSYGVIDASCGFGKTFIFEAIAHLFPTATIDIVVKPKDVANRICKQLTRSFPNVGLVGDGSKFIGERITVYTADSSHYSAGTADFLLVDEAHQLMTKKTSEVLANTWRFSRRFAFSATPDGRMDGASACLEMLFGRTIFKLAYPDAVKLGLVVPIHVRWLPIVLTHNPVRDATGVMKDRWGLWRNDERNKAIAADIYSHYTEDTQILILVATVDHAVHLKKYLPTFELVYGGKLDPDVVKKYKKNGLLGADFVPMDTKRRDMLRNNFEAGTLKHVIATDVWATGVDFVNLQVMYRADARESEILSVQGPARVSRIATGTGKAHGEVIDCLDAFDPGLKRKAQNRRRLYAKLGWSQDWPTIY